MKYDSLPVMRDVFEEDDVASLRDTHESANPRIRDAWRALVWSLSIEPEPKESKLLNITGSNCRIYTQGAVPVANVPAITVVYLYDEKKIEIKAAMFNETIAAVQKQSAQ